MPTRYTKNRAMSSVDGNVKIRSNKAPTSRQSAIQKSKERILLHEQLTGRDRKEYDRQLKARVEEFGGAQTEFFGMGFENQLQLRI